MIHWGGDFGMGFGGGIFMIFFWVLIFLGIIYLGKMILGGGDADKPHETTREVLKKRFARGEISKEEFEDAIEVLKRNQT